MNIKDIYIKYNKHIVILLIILACFNGCKSCSQKRANEYNSFIYCNTIDSIETVIDNQQDVIDSLNNIIYQRDTELNIMRDNNQILINTNKHFIRTNKVLVDSNKDLINKRENKNEEHQ